MKRESPQKIERARYTLYYDELVVLKNIGDRAHLDEKMVQDADYVSSLGENSLYNYAKMLPPTPSLTKETSKKIPLGPKTSSETSSQAALFRLAPTADDMAIQIRSAFLQPVPR